MTTANANPVWEESHEDIFRHANRDLDLLILLLLIELADSGRKSFRFTELIKGDYWGIPYVKNEMTDTNDHQSVEDFVLSLLGRTLHDLEIGKIKSVSIESGRSAYTSLIRKIRGIDDEDDAIEFGQWALEKYNEILRGVGRREDGNAGYGDGFTVPLKEGSEIFVANEMSLLPDELEIGIDFDARKIIEIKKQIADFIDLFGSDEFLYSASTYQGKRSPFTLQMERFGKYLKQLGFIGSVVHVPFNVLKEQGFEAVKLIHVLQYFGADLSWAVDDAWRLNLSGMPESAQKMLGLTINESKGDEAGAAIKTGAVTFGQEVASDVKPSLVVESGVGYLKFYKQGQKFKIGKVETRKYRLLSCLLDPPGTAKTTDAVYDAIKTSKDDDDTQLTGVYTEKTRKIEIIVNTMKELQKIDGLKGRVILKKYQMGRSVALNIK